MGTALGSKEMGPPVRVVVEGRVVFVCCEGCIADLKKNPAKYLAKLPHDPSHH
jgi:membrane fusion protein, copper/silver efflux system